MTVKKMTLQDFKGHQNRTFKFGKPVAKIVGENGTGKSTIATAFYWVLADKSVDLQNNPDVQPIGKDECSPRVELTLEIAGKEVIASRTQNYKKNGDMVSVSNIYEVNGVEYGKRAFEKKMRGLGFDFELFLPLSHPDYFTNQKVAEMRTVLFSMANQKTDEEIADLAGGMPELKALLGNYTIDEVAAMQNAAMKKIRSEYGKAGEILRAQIKGLENAKTDADFAELELHQNILKEKISAVKEKIEDVYKQSEEYERLSDGILELKFAEGDLQRKANEENIKHRREIEDKISDKQFLVRQTEKTIFDTEQQIVSSKRSIFTHEKWLDDTRVEWKAENERVFDKNSLICSYCGQEYPVEKKEQLKIEFESHKAIQLQVITNSGNTYKERLEKEKKTLADLETELPQHKESLEMLETAITDLTEQLSELPTSIDISDTEEYKNIQSQIAEKEKALEQMNNASDIKQTLNAELGDLQSQLTECEKQIALAQKNVEIDEKISELQEKGMEYEQEKADCEKVLYQIELLNKKKNEVLTGEINKHFAGVQWQLFEYLKNGEVKDCCVPLIDGKRIGEDMNTGLGVFAKLEIIKGLQSFYGKNYPVFLDGAECLSYKTREKIQMPCQMLYLNVSDGELEVCGVD